MGRVLTTGGWGRVGLGGLVPTARNVEGVRLSNDERNAEEEVSLRL
jgi:hypothetical protein